MVLDFVRVTDLVFYVHYVKQILVIIFYLGLFCVKCSGMSEFVNSAVTELAALFALC